MVACSSIYFLSVVLSSSMFVKVFHAAMTYILHDYHFHLSPLFLLMHP